MVNNVVHSFRLEATSFDKKSYLTYLKVISIPIYLVLAFGDVRITAIGLYENCQEKAPRRPRRRF